MAIDTIVGVVTGARKCEGFAGAMVCFGCTICWRGMIFDDFAFVLHEGSIYLHWPEIHDMEVMFQGVMETNADERDRRGKKWDVSSNITQVWSQHAYGQSNGKTTGP
jgi:hypothetical protein